MSGKDFTITMATRQWQLSAFAPASGSSTLKSILCLDGIAPNVGFLHAQMNNSIGSVTVLNPRTGYEAATAVAKGAPAKSSPSCLR